MFTWINKAWAPPLLAALFLAGCMADTGDTPRSIDVADGALRIVGPAGYCVDAETSRPGRAMPTVVLLPCAVFTDAGRALGPVPLLSVSLSPPISTVPDPEVLGIWAASGRGRATISRAGKAETVEVSDTLIADGVIYLTVQDRAQFPAGAVGARYWRALFVLEGRMTAASVYMPIGVSDEAAIASGPPLLRKFVASLQRANSP